MITSLWAWLVQWNLDVPGVKCQVPGVGLFHKTKRKRSGHTLESHEWRIPFKPTVHYIHNYFPLHFLVVHKEFPWRKGERQKGHQDLPPGFATWICHLDWPPGLATWISPLDPGFATWWWNSLLIGPLLPHAHNMQPKLWIDSLALRFLRISSTAALIHYKFILEAFKGQKPNRRVNNYHWYSIAQSVLENFNISRPAKITQTNLPSSSPSSTHYLVRFPNPLATGHSWQLGNLTTHYLAQHREEGLLLGQHRGGEEMLISQ